MEIIFAVIGGLTAFFKYRNSKTENRDSPVEVIRSKPVSSASAKPGGGRLARIADWLGVEIV